jgi:hypothetical protein
LAGPRKRQSQGDEPPTIVDEINDIDEDTESQTSGLPDVFRKMMAMGLSGLFTTEAAVRGALGDSVPREWVDFVSEQSERTREEILDLGWLHPSRARAIVNGVDLRELQAAAKEELGWEVSDVTLSRACRALKRTRKKSR